MAEQNPALEGLRCPRCRHLIDAATDVERGGRQPEPDDVSVCIYCATPLRFTAGLDLVCLTDRELEEMDRETYQQLCAVIHAVREVMGTR